ncbi:MAG TPA: sigma-54 dependent transcriptional regulator [Syntrophomonadaceae bacterium]|jgi:DNA-binding NtrC family response regulator|nr:sigma-54 dependent transcriptional regulator [Syntrophomonadaceae bacterium]HRX21645.1 sigma-54 dependent transcriptional regulator [Syntrophomonadaceae bacterium]
MNEKSKKPLIMVVDDEENIRLLLEKVLRSENVDVITLDNGQKALNFVRTNQVAITIMDIRMPKTDGLEVLKKIKAQDPDAIIIMLTAFATIKTAVEAMRIGAFDYLTKPFELDELHVCVNRALKMWDLMEENRDLRAQINKKLPGNILCSDNPKMKKIESMLKKIAKSDHTLMIYGETGTGKSMIAKTVHQFSNRKDAPFVWLNCAALPEHLIESELFGYEKGAFTGAAQQKKGQMEMADKGTLFLDELSILSPSAQGKLLLALQEGEFQRVGGSKPIKVDVRIIAASNQPLKAMVERGEFRADLFYRLNVINLELPPLRERPEDIIPLAQYFITRYSSRENETLLSADTARKLLGYHWPGNIRELENVVKQAAVLGGTERIMAPEHFIFCEEPAVSDECSLKPGETLKDALLRLERKIINTVLSECNDQVAEAADRLGVSVRTIYRHI